MSVELNTRKNHDYQNGSEEVRYFGRSRNRGYNPPYDELFREETKPGLEGFEKRQLTDMGAVNVMTGVYTGRSPKDKFFVLDDTTRDTIWWTSDEYKNDNKPVTGEAWKELKKIAADELSGKKLYVVDTFCGANENTRLKIRFIMEVAWQAHFVKNMFIRPTDAEAGAVRRTRLRGAQRLESQGDELQGAGPELRDGRGLQPHREDAGHHQHLVRRRDEEGHVLLHELPAAAQGHRVDALLGQHQRAGRDGHLLRSVGHGQDHPFRPTPSASSSATTSTAGTTTAYSTSRAAATPRSSTSRRENEPDIWNAIRRNALLENVTVNAEGAIDFADKSVTENTRVSYPIYHIENIVKPVSKAPAARKVIFLSADAFGVLPPVSILTPEQTKYYFLSGFTAKLAGTERGITEPTPTFSACFGAAFLSLHPTKYGEELVKRMKQSGATAYLVNTGWNGTGKRISIKDTRGIIDAILDGSIDKAPTKMLPIFDSKIPTALPGVDPAILDPRDTYADAAEWERRAEDLAARFVKNFTSSRATTRARAS